MIVMSCRFHKIHWRWRVFFSVPQYAKLAITLKVPGGGKKKKPPAAAASGDAGAVPPEEDEDEYAGGLC